MEVITNENTIYPSEANQFLEESESEETDGGGSEVDINEFFEIPRYPDELLELNNVTIHNVESFLDTFYEQECSKVLQHKVETQQAITRISDLEYEHSIKFPIGGFEFHSVCGYDLCSKFPQTGIEKVVMIDTSLNCLLLEIEEGRILDTSSHQLFNILIETLSISACHKHDMSYVNGCLTMISEGIIQEWRDNTIKMREILESHIVLEEVKQHEILGNEVLIYRDNILSFADSYYHDFSWGELLMISSYLPNIRGFVRYDFHNSRRTEVTVYNCDYSLVERHFDTFTKGLPTNRKWEYNRINRLSVNTFGDESMFERILDILHGVSMNDDENILITEFMKDLDPLCFDDTKLPISDTCYVNGDTFLIITKDPNFVFDLSLISNEPVREIRVLDIFKGETTIMRKEYQSFEEPSCTIC